MNQDAPNDSSESETIRAEVSIRLSGARLDKALVELFPDYSRARLQGWLKEGRVTVNGAKPSKNNQKVKAKDWIELTPGLLEHMQAAKSEDLDLEVVAQHDQYWVINKPSGLVVHPAPGHWSGTLMNGLLHLDAELLHVPRAGIVHRLDQDTSGLLAVARTNLAQVALIQMLQARIVKRVYLALVWGRVGQSRTINQPIGRDVKNRLRMAVTDFGKPAVTHFTPVLVGELMGLPVTVMVCRLETGRTHQIRVHAQHAGFALVGDPVYKLRGAGSHSVLKHQCIELPDGGLFARQALHAAYLGFPVPSAYVAEVEGADLSWGGFVAQPPSDLVQLAQMAQIDLLCPSIALALEREAAIHRGLSAPLVDAPIDDDDFDDLDWDVEVEQIRDE